MFKKIGLYLRTKLALRNNEIVRNPTPFNEAKKFGIMVQNYSENKNSIIKMIENLKKEGKKVQILNYENGDIPHDSENISNFTKKDLSWSGKVMSEEYDNFLKTDFDYLISLNTSSFLPFEKILALNKAKCRVGIYDSKKENLYELMIDSKGNPSLETSATEMLNLTKKI